MHHPPAPRIALAKQTLRKCTWEKRMPWTLVDILEPMGRDGRCHPTPCEL